MNTPKISVIIPVYNVESYLREGLDSVVNQTLRDIEIICVNDGSTDNSGAILTEYAAQDKRITVITQENRGLSAARNTGINAAKGEYIYFIDSDDYIDLNALEVLYNRAEELELDVLLFDYSNFCDGVDEVRWQPNRSGYEDVYTGLSLLKRLRDNKEYSVAVWQMLIQRDCLCDMQLYFYEGIIYEDYLFTTRLLMASKRVSHDAHSFHHRRLRPGSITTVPTTRINVESYVIELYEFFHYGLTCGDDPELAAEIWRSIVELQKKAKKEFKKIDKDEQATIRYSVPFTDYLHQCFVVDSVKTDKKVAALKKENIKLQEELSAQQKKTTAAEKRAAAAQKEISGIRRSVTYRIGRVITWLPRMVRGFVRCYREHGWGYTWQRVVAHLRGR